jgi:hypothetical protein
MNVYLFDLFSSLPGAGSNHRHLIQVDCLLCFDSGEFEEYKGVLNAGAKH